MCQAHYSELILSLAYITYLPFLLTEDNWAFQLISTSKSQLGGTWSTKHNCIMETPSWMRVDVGDVYKKIALFTHPYPRLYKSKRKFCSLKEQFQCSWRCEPIIPEGPIRWSSDAKIQLIGRDPDAGKDWRQEEKGTAEDEIVQWHHQFNGLSLRKLRELVKDGEAWHAAVHGVPKSWTLLSNWTATTTKQE